jgi:uncharacterized protein YaaW (UPF0174 family)
MEASGLFGRGHDACWVAMMMFRGSGELVGPIARARLFTISASVDVIGTSMRSRMPVTIV